MGLMCLAPIEEAICEMTQNDKKTRDVKIPPHAVRSLGVELNYGRVHGWIERLSYLLDTPPLTIRAWASTEIRNYRPIPGSASRLLLMLVDALRNDKDIDKLIFDANSSVLSGINLSIQKQKSDS